MHYLNLGERVVDRLSSSFTVKKNDIGRCAKLSKGGKTFYTESYRVEGAGHLCVMKMSAMLGLMKMETVVLAPIERDLPLFNMDWVGVLGNETFIVELYDDQLSPCPQEIMDRLNEIKEKDEDLADYSSKEAHWFDDILYPASYHKTGKRLSYRFSDTAERYYNEFISRLEAAPVCDMTAKEEKVRSFAETLYKEGGPAVDQVKKLFGEKIAGELIVEHMYGISIK
ncbi:MAG: hypothetical protein IK152_09205 [Lachnospiraceae bacterium]|nr:hypothetical protein [Lachnospiraceae bacterium]